MCISLPDNEASMISSDDEFMQDYQSDGKFLYKKKRGNLESIERIRGSKVEIIRPVLQFCNSYCASV